MNSRRRLRQAQSGVAVIAALLLTTLAITLVASLFWQQQVQVRSIENQRLQLQKQWILRGALDWARLILREEARASNTVNLDEPWAVPLAETSLDDYVENGNSGDNRQNNTDEKTGATLSGYMTDAQARYNLTNMCPSGTIVQSEVTVFARLLAFLNLNPALAQATANMMAAAQKAPAGSPADTPLPLPLSQIDDLLAVPGFSPEMLDILRDYVVVLPAATPINVNTASAQVIAAHVTNLGLPDAANIVASRNQAYFRDLADFVQRFPGKPLAAAADGLSVSSGFFLVNGTVRLSRASMDMQSLIGRTGLSTRVVWVKEN